MTDKQTPPSTIDAPRGRKGHRWFAGLYDKMNRAQERGFLGKMRGRLLSGLSGDVLEIGAGTGANFEHYPADARITALEPDPFMRKRAEAKLATLQRTNITLHAAPAEQLPYPDGSFDTVVSTLVLCTVRDVSQSLAEMRRVLRPGGEIRFIEHVRGTGFVGRTQDFLKPVWGWFGAGCNPNRRTEDLLRAAGCDVAVDERRTVMGLVPIIRGSAKPAATEP